MIRKADEALITAMEKLLAWAYDMFGWRQADIEHQLTLVTFVAWTAEETATRAYLTAIILGVVAIAEASVPTRFTRGQRIVRRMSIFHLCVRFAWLVFFFNALFTIFLEPSFANAMALVASTAFVLVVFSRPAILPNRERRRRRVPAHELEPMSMNA